jgi:hypothetical protein
MINFIDPHSDEFKKIQSISFKHSCLICEQPLKDNGVYFSILKQEEDPSDESDNDMILYRLGCKYCKTVYTVDFKILSIDFEKFPNFVTRNIPHA